MNLLGTTLSSCGGHGVVVLDGGAVPARLLTRRHLWERRAIVRAVLSAGSQHPTGHRLQPCQPVAASASSSTTACVCADDDGRPPTACVYAPVPYEFAPQSSRACARAAPLSGHRSPPSNGPPPASEQKASATRRLLLSIRRRRRRKKKRQKKKMCDVRPRSGAEWWGACAWHLALSELPAYAGRACSVGSRARFLSPLVPCLASPSTYPSYASSGLLCVVCCM